MKGQGDDDDDDDDDVWMYTTLIGGQTNKINTPHNAVCKRGRQTTRWTECLKMTLNLQV